MSDAQQSNYGAPVGGPASFPQDPRRRPAENPAASHIDNTWVTFYRLLPLAHANAPVEIRTIREDLRSMSYIYISYDRRLSAQAEVFLGGAPALIPKLLESFLRMYARAGKEMIFYAHFPWLVTEPGTYHSRMTKLLVENARETVFWLGQTRSPSGGILRIFEIAAEEWAQAIEAVGEVDNEGLRTEKWLAV
ncbi:hypothetical protein ANO14919_088200 [Xylariales sp. No.14919]|nr:hypothetical protein F5X98DRAFT_303451 [Xylaria grammica]GAW19334.1 hypothetical protein ANO14919_088200 [Xylariales sp. No.14919]